VWRGRPRPRRGRPCPQRGQFSTKSPFTQLNSFSFSVTIAHPSASAWSSGPKRQVRWARLRGHKWPLFHGISKRQLERAILQGSLPKSRKKKSNRDFRSLVEFHPRGRIRIQFGPFHQPCADRIHANVIGVMRVILLVSNTMIREALLPYQSSLRFSKPIGESAFDQLYRPLQRNVCGWCDQEV